MKDTDWIELHGYIELKHKLLKDDIKRIAHLPIFGAKPLISDPGNSTMYYLIEQTPYQGKPLS